MKHRTTGERRIIIFFENRRDVHSGARRSRNNQNANAPPPLFLDQSRSCCICAAGLFPSPGQNIFLLSLVTESFRVSDSPIQRDDNEGPWTPEQPSAFLFCCSLLRFYFICRRREDGGRTAALSIFLNRFLLLSNICQNGGVSLQSRGAGAREEEGGGEVT
jgi:hypothetical protein